MTFKIVNDITEDNHMHTSTFSDGLNSVDEMGDYAGRFGLKKITITDHSQASIDTWRINHDVYVGGTRWNLHNYKNVINNVDVNFGIEADLLDENGTICGGYGGKVEDYLILSVHTVVYKGNWDKLTDGFEKAILENKDKIKCIGHPTMKRKGLEHLDIDRLVEFANKNNIPLELNGSNLLNGKSNLDILRKMLEKAKLIMVNSDAHNLYQLKEARTVAYDFLRKEGYLKE